MNKKDKEQTTNQNGEGSASIIERIHRGERVEVKAGEDLGLGFMSGTNLPRIAKKVAIVGFAPSTMTEARAHFEDPDFEIWALNQLNISFPAITNKATRWFQIHNKTSYETAVRDHSHHGFLAGLQMPVYMQERVEDVPCSVPFPALDIMKRYGDYFTNSISWMIALAIYEGFEEIAIYGVDMAQDDEYAEQRPSCEYFIGLARGMGVKVHIPAASDLCKTMYLYPFEDSKKFRVKCASRRTELRARMNEAANAEQQSHDARIHCVAKLEIINEIIENTENEKEKERLEEKRVEIRKQMHEAANAEQQAHDARLQLLGAIEDMNYIEKTWMVSNNEMSVTRDHIAMLEGGEDAKS